MLFRFKYSCKLISVMLICILMHINNYAVFSSYAKENISDLKNYNCISPKSYFEVSGIDNGKHKLDLRTIYRPTVNELESLEKASFWEIINDSGIKFVSFLKNVLHVVASKFSLNKFFIILLFSVFFSLPHVNAQDIQSVFPEVGIVQDYRKSIYGRIGISGVLSEDIENDLRRTAVNAADLDVRKEAVRILYEQNCLESLNSIVYGSHYSLPVRKEAFFRSQKNTGVYFLIEFVNRMSKEETLSGANYLLLQRSLFSLLDYISTNKAAFVNIKELNHVRKAELINALFLLLESGIADSVAQENILDVFFSAFSDSRDIAKLVAGYDAGSNNSNSLIHTDIGFEFFFHNSEFLRDAAVLELKRRSSEQYLRDLSKKSVPDNSLLKFIFNESKVQHASFLYVSAREGNYNEKWIARLLPDIANKVEIRVSHMTSYASQYQFFTNTVSDKFEDVRLTGSINSSSSAQRKDAVRELIKHNQFSFLSYLAASASYYDVRLMAIDALKDNIFYLLQIHNNAKFADMRRLSYEYLSQIVLHQGEKLNEFFASNISVKLYLISLLRNVSLGQENDILLKSYLNMFLDPFVLLDFSQIVSAIPDLAKSDVAFVEEFAKKEVKRKLAMVIVESKLNKNYERNSNSLFSDKDEEIVKLEDVLQVLENEAFKNLDDCLQDFPGIRNDTQQWFDQLSHFSKTVDTGFFSVQRINQSFFGKFLLLFGLSFSIFLVPVFFARLLFLKSKKIHKKDYQKTSVSEKKAKDNTVDTKSVFWNEEDFNTKEGLLQLKSVLDNETFVDVSAENKILKKLSMVLGSSKETEVLDIGFDLYKKIIFRIYQRKSIKKDDELKSAILNQTRESVKPQAGKTKISDIFLKIKDVLRGKGFLSNQMLEKLSDYESQNSNIMSDFVSLRKKIKFSAYILSFAQYGLVVIPFFLSMFYVVPASLNVVLLVFLGFFVGAELFNQWLLQKIEVKEKFLGALIRKIGLDFKISRANLPSAWHIITGELSRWYVFQLGLTVLSITAALFFVEIAFVPFFIGLVVFSGLVVLFSVFSQKGILKQQDQFLKDYQQALSVLEDNVALGVEYDFEKVLAGMKKSSKNFRVESVKFSSRLFLLIKIGIPLVGVLLGFPLQGYLLSTYLYSFFGTNYFIRSVFESLFHVKMLKKLLNKIDTSRQLTKVKWNQDVSVDKRQNYFDQGWIITEIKLSNYSVRLPNTNKYIIRNQSITFPKGKIFRISASSGLGKSTLAKIISSVWDNRGGSGDKLFKLKNRKGEIKWVSATPNNFDLDDIRSRIKYIDMADFPSGSTVDILLKRFKIDQKAFFDALGELIPGLEIADYEILGKTLFEFSHGERLRIELILILLFYKDKDVSHLVLDEPFANLDKKSIEKVFDYLKTWQKKSASKDVFGKYPALIIIDHNLPSSIEGIDQNISFSDGQFVDYTEYRLQEKINEVTLSLHKTSGENEINFEIFADTFDVDMLADYCDVLGFDASLIRENITNAAALTNSPKGSGQAEVYISKYLADRAGDFTSEGLDLLLSYPVDIFKVNLSLCDKYRLSLNQDNIAIWETKSIFTEDMVLMFSLQNVVKHLLADGGVSVSNMLKNSDWKFFHSIFKIDPQKFLTVLDSACGDMNLARKIIAQMNLMSFRLQKYSTLNSDQTPDKESPEKTIKSKKKGLGSVLLKLIPLVLIILFSFTKFNFFVDIAKKSESFLKASYSGVNDPNLIFSEYFMWSDKTDDTLTFENGEIESDVVSDVVGLASDYCIDSIYAYDNGSIIDVVPENTYVEKGDVIARFVSPKKDILLQKLSAGNREFSSLRRRLSQEEVLFEEGYVSREKIEELRREVESAKNRILILEEQLKRFLIFAHASGKIEYANDFIAQGYSFVQGDALFNIIDIRQKNIRLNLPSIYAHALRVGTEITVRIDGIDILSRVDDIKGELKPYNKELLVSLLISDSLAFLQDGNQYSLSVSLPTASETIVFPFHKYYFLDGFVMPAEDVGSQFVSQKEGYIDYIYDNEVLAGINIINPVLDIRISEALSVQNRLKHLWELNQHLYDTTGGISANEVERSYNKYLNAREIYLSLLSAKNRSYTSISPDWEIISLLPPEGKYIASGENLFAYNQNKNSSSVTALVAKEDIGLAAVGDFVYVHIQGNKLLKATLDHKGVEENGYIPFVFVFDSYNESLPPGFPLQILLPKENESSDVIHENWGDSGYIGTDTLYMDKEIMFEISA